MATWKKAIIFGSLGLGGLLFARRRRPAAVAATTVGLVVLAAEYPEKFEAFWENAPGYVTRGVAIFQTLSSIAERFAEQAAKRGAGALREVSEDWGS